MWGCFKERCTQLNTLQGYPVQGGREGIEIRGQRAEKGRGKRGLAPQYDPPEADKSAGTTPVKYAALSFGI